MSENISLSSIRVLALAMLCYLASSKRLPTSAIISSYFYHMKPRSRKPVIVYPDAHQSKLNQQVMYDKRTTYLSAWKNQESQILSFAPSLSRCVEGKRKDVFPLILGCRAALQRLFQPNASGLARINTHPWVSMAQTNKRFTNYQLIWYQLLSYRTELCIVQEMYISISVPPEYFFSPLMKQDHSSSAAQVLYMAMDLLRILGFAFQNIRYEASVPQNTTPEIVFKRASLYNT